MNEIIEWLTASRILPVFQACLLVVLGYITGRFASRAVAKIFANKLTDHGRLILQRVVFYLILTLALISALQQLGLDLNVILGAAGILSVAIGFASQTSASNLISGLFLMVERPFSVNDIIRVGTTTGEVISIDLLSVKLRTLDNLFVRIPNETMIKTEVTTLTRFPIRRADLMIGIAYKENIEAVRTVLMDLAAENPLCLDEPAPLFIILGFGTSSVDLQFSVWAKRENFLRLKNSILEEIKVKFDELAIEIPFPHVSLYAGSASEPLPVTVVDSRAEPPTTQENKL